MSNNEKDKPAESNPLLLTALRSLITPRGIAISICGSLKRKYPGIRYSPLDIKNAIEALKIEQPTNSDLLAEIDKAYEEIEKKNVQLPGGGPG